MTSLDMMMILDEINKLRPFHEQDFCSLAPTVGALGEAKAHGMREFIMINDRLSRACPASETSALGAFLPTVGALGDTAEGKRTIVKWSLYA
jgi:hypothetical protein